MKKTFVIVLYKLKVEQSNTFRSLKDTLLVEDRQLDNIELILYDNSPQAQEFNIDQYRNINITYKHDARNLGISTAYNYALSIAKANGSEWLLLLDHDTEITNEYMKQIMDLNEMNEHIVGVIPRIISENVMISPVYSNTLRPLHVKRPVAGIQEQPVMAINSGTLLRVKFLEQIGGFNDEFPLDYLDHWLFHQIYETGYKVWLLNTMLEHELSVMDYSRVSITRYKNILESEINFYKNYKSDLYRSYRIQLAKRFIKQLVTIKNKKIALHTLRRLFLW
ncbi:glycosyltransferase [Bacillus sp. T33-2]|uniref:glycosyltransferase n=1 Tax=Bacillus sp. T33-2 TaxID=2054168 RepID=UPI000C760BE4|nr:glycosyltransferase [Bacillus sp. T33-2]PLR90790.1 hypothetical protein CVD19_22425 [Bacillus sp. T33-2]